jgi:hypothetical protein
MASAATATASAAAAMASAAPAAAAAAAPSAASPCKPYAGAKFSFFVEKVPKLTSNTSSSARRILFP